MYYGSRKNIGKDRSRLSDIRQESHPFGTNGKIKKFAGKIQWLRLKSEKKTEKAGRSYGQHNETEMKTNN